MRTSSPGRRQAVAGLALVALGTIGVASALPASAGTTAPAQSSGPTFVPGNPTCGDLAPAGTTWTELKVDPVQSGESSDGTLTVTIDVMPNEETGPTFDWTSNIGVDAVFVKGGPGGNLYTYDPESTGDSGLHAPTNPENDKFFGLSHVSFCYDDDNGTTTTTEATTTTTGESTTTTTTGESTTTTTGPVTTSTTVVPPSTTAPGAAPSTTVPMEQLPRTGRMTGPLLALSGLLVAAGIALIASSRRLRHA